MNIGIELIQTDKDKLATQIEITHAFGVAGSD